MNCLKVLTLDNDLIKLDQIIRTTLSLEISLLSKKSLKKPKNSQEQEFLSIDKELITSFE